MPDSDTVLAPVELLDTPALAAQYHFLLAQLDDLTGYELQRLADIEAELTARAS